MKNVSEHPLLQEKLVDALQVITCLSKLLTEANEEALHLGQMASLITRPFHTLSLDEEEEEDDFDVLGFVEGVVGGIGIFGEQW